ncbi:GNAT family N-acetyltransferase [Pseudaestuariivita sp.]|uniref:GNAT family N-acetyltransferase n=1 Tax=Pseudaestuariivita sp. TaxID=2211669 RepID=UPI00405944D3
MTEIAVTTTHADALDWAQCCIEEPGRWAWQVKSAGKTVGFALVRRDNPGHMDFSEFCIEAPFRGQGIGRDAAHAVLAKYAGPWSLGALPRPLAFWRRTLASCPGLTNLTERPSPLAHQAAQFTFTMKESSP